MWTLLFYFIFILQTPTVIPNNSPTVTIPPSLLFAPTLSPTPNVQIVYIRNYPSLGGPYGNGTLSQNPTQIAAENNRESTFITDAIIVAVITVIGSTLAAVYVARTNRATAHEHEKSSLLLEGNKFLIEKIQFLETENREQLDQIKNLHDEMIGLQNEIKALKSQLENIGSKLNGEQT